MIVFEYSLELKQGFKPTCSEQVVNDVSFQLVAPNRATADRIVKSFINENVSYYDCVAIATVNESEV